MPSPRDVLEESVKAPVTIVGPNVKKWTTKEKLGLVAYNNNLRQVVGVLEKYFAIAQSYGQHLNLIKGADFLRQLDAETAESHLCSS